MEANLFLAILAMDSYDRDYNQGVFVTPQRAGDDAAGVQIGDATVYNHSAIVPDSFYGIAYNWEGVTVISYRGTDDTSLLNLLNGDLLNGWTLGAGSAGAPQATDASQFYQQVTGLGIFDGPAPDLVLTGHSLGGGLAGFIASVTGARAYIYNWMPYAGAAVGAVLAKDFTLGLSNLLSLFTGGPLAGFLGLPSSGSITGTYTSGEALTGARAVAPTLEAGILSGGNTALADATKAYLTAIDYPPDTRTVSAFDDSLLSAINLHSQALLVLLLWAQDNGQTNWHDIGNPLYKAMFDDRLGTDLKLGSNTGTASAAGQMLRMIAYSAIDTGTEVFGSTGIKSLFQDATTVDKLVTSQDAAKYLKDSSVQDALASVFVEYAGLLAVNQEDTQDAIGIIDFDSANNKLGIDFSGDTWKITGPDTTNPPNTPAKIVGKQDLMDSLVNFSGASKAELKQAIDKVWGGSNDNIVKLVAATTTEKAVLDESGDQDIHGPDSKPTDGAMMVGGDGNDTLTGTSGNDLLIGGGGDNTFDGQGGNDIMFGGSGNDTFTLSGGGTNWIDGGGGTKDKVVYNTSDPLTEVISAANGVNAAGQTIITVTDNKTNTTDYISSVDTIKLGTGHNKVIVQSIPGLISTDPVTDLGATDTESGDILDLSALATVNMSSARNPPGVNGASELYADDSFTQDEKFGFTGYNTLIAGNGNNKIDLHTSDNPKLKELNVGNGNDKVRSDVVNLTINLGNGTDTIYTVGPGTVVNAGSGKDTFMVSNDELIAGTGGNTNDVIITQGGLILHGFVGPINSDSPWITSIYNGVSYGLNSEGQLAIKDTLGNITYVAGYTGGTNVPLSQQTDGIFVGRGSLKSSRLADLKRPAIEEDANVFKFANEIAYVRLGHPEYPGNDDPLVLDLSGNGVNLTGETSVSPMFDMNGTGFAVHTGWTQPGTGLLVLPDANGNVENINQLVGGENSSGFAALAQYDANHDGVIDANDPNPCAMGGIAQTATALPLAPAIVRVE
jgi:hypothetical protein